MHPTFERTGGRHRPQRMPLVIAQLVADRQIVKVAAAAIDERLDVFKGCGLWQDVLPAHPAWNHAVQLTRHCFVNFAPGVGEPAHRCFCFCFIRAVEKQAQWAAARIRRSRTPSQITDSGSVSIQIN